MLSARHSRWTNVAFIVPDCSSAMLQATVAAYGLASRASLSHVLVYF